MAARQPYIVPALSKHTATVIFAHGLGDSGAGWQSRMPVVENWRLRRKFPECKFIFPNAPNIAITVNFGIKMPGWYDITNFDSLSTAHDESGILKSRDYFNSLIAAEVTAGIPSTRIILGGFSQGGAISLFTGITSTQKLGGVFGLSSYMLLHDRIASFLPAPSASTGTPTATLANRQETTIFMGHGDSDPLVRYEWGVATAKVLRDLGWTVDLKTYKGLEHSADPKEIDDLATYLSSQLG